MQSFISSDAKNFWSFIQSKKQQTRIPGKMFYEGEEYNNPNEIVNKFSQFFSSVYLPPNENIYNHSVSNNYSEHIGIGTITISEVQDAIKRLKNKLTSGPDLIPSFIVRDCGNVFSLPLCILFNISIKTATFPNIWKLAKICPVFKNGDLALICNYRAISLLCNFAKVFEIVLYNRIYLSTKLLISPFQHGFMENRSTVTNLVIFTQFVSDILDEKGQVDVIYTDFSKAFDRIDHCILLNKLENFGFSADLLLFFKSYLSDRKQFVIYNGFKSSIFTASSGVPQGSNLGPLLFLLFVNDLCSEIDCQKLLFADDLKIFQSISSVDDCIVLQSELDKVQNWCNFNNLNLNAAKCKIVTYTKKQSRYEHNYNIDGTVLDRQNSIKDLGIIFDSQLSFTQHINNKSSEATKMLGFIIRNCKTFTNILALKVLYFSYVRSKLEYGSIVWNPYYSVHKLTIEKVQRKFLKFLSYKTDGIYPERGFDHAILLDIFKFDSLEMRRCCSSLTFLYKLLHNKIDCPIIVSQIPFNVPRPHSRQNLTFYCNLARTNVLLKSPIQNMCENFNKLSDICDINSDTIDKIRKCTVEYI